MLVAFDEPRALQIGDLLSAGALQRLAAEGRQGQRRLLGRLLGAAGGDDDVFDLGRSLLRRHVLRLSGRGHCAECGARQQGGLHESVHVHPNLVSGPIDAFYSAFNDFQHR